MLDLLERLLPVFLAFVLGLIAEPIKRFLTKEKRRIRYNINQKSLVSVTDDLPDSLVQRFPEIRSKNTITETEIMIVSAGSAMIKQANCIIRASNSQILEYEISEDPSGLVAHTDTVNAEIGELRIGDFGLEPGQSIKCKLYLQSTSVPGVLLEGNSTDNIVTWTRGIRAARGLDDHILSVFKIWILAAFISPVVSGIFLLLATLVRSMAGNYYRNEVSIFMGFQSIGNVFGSLLSLYFYLLMVPHVIKILAVLDRRVFSRWE